jgi:hypothetical protein
VTTFDAFRTNLKEDRAAVGKTPVAGGKAVLTLPPRSIVTLYGKAG